MGERFQTVFGAGFFSALIFGAFGAPQRWQLLAFATGAAVALVFVFDKTKERTDAR